MEIPGRGAMNGIPTSAGISSAASCSTVSKAGLSNVATLNGSSENVEKPHENVNPRKKMDM
jgi:hypothetical protein